VRVGDGEDAAFLESLPLREVRWIVSTFPQWASNRALLNALRAAHYEGRIMVAARDSAHARALQAAGVTLVLNPFDDAAEHAARRLAHDILGPATPA